MFGRKKGYEDENGDYIRPVEEYRRDCEEYHEHGQTYNDYDYRKECDDHSHGQTYNDYDYRKECDDHSHGQTYNDYDYRKECDDHSHGQTYSNHNSEMSDYEDSESVKQIFQKSLRNDEYILWSGSSVKANAKERGSVGCIMVFPVMWLAFSILWTLTTAIVFLPMALFGLPFIAVGVFLFKLFSGVGKAKYAITNKRVLFFDGTNMNQTALANIASYKVFCSERNIGYISFMLHTQIHSNTVYNGIFGIKDPKGAARILGTAISECRRNSVKR